MLEIIMLSIAISACSNEDTSKTKVDDTPNTAISKDITAPKTATANSSENKVEISSTFENKTFQDSIEMALLNEINICYDTLHPDERKKGMSLCSPENFAFYTYSDKISLENGFLLQVKAGVNDYPIRRLLFFIRENGRLVSMNNVQGYLVEKRHNPSGFDDLVVSLVDNLDGTYQRYDVLLQYQEGKYHLVEALADLYGPIETPEMKKNAKAFFEERIRKNKLMF
ncbi:hypothetical protein [Lishizhenia tianjinensis]|nr:hypothetical protein [Lishizhenia tianjinensis]